MTSAIDMTTDRTKETSRKAAHNAKVRAKIVSAAAQKFREHGYDGVGLNDLMAAADLTRGAFYAHFKSKDLLFAEVVGAPHLLLERLLNRNGTNATALWGQCEAIFRDYLSPRQLGETWRGCSLAGLGVDAARRSADVKSAFEWGHRTLLREMARGQTFQADHPALIAGLTLATGAVATASASANPSRRSLVLVSADKALHSLWAVFRSEQTDAQAPRSS